MIKTLHLQDFTAFADLQLQLGQGVNVLVGENGTGKTLLLKAAYALGGAAGALAIGAPVQDMDEKFSRVFTPSADAMLQLRRNGAAGEAQMFAEFANGAALDVFPDRPFDKRWNFSYPANATQWVMTGQMQGRPATPIPPPVFIPSKEVLTLAHQAAKNGAGRGVLQDLFDDSHLDLLDALMRDGADLSDGGDTTLDPRYVRMLRNLINLIGGDFRWRDGDFYLHAGRWVDDGSEEESDRDGEIFNYNDFRRPRFIDGGEVCGSALSAEGFRKIGMLQRLIANGALSPAGGVLLWDEPEANLNPKLACMVAKVLLELADTGYQIILATHENALLKWIDLLVKYHKCDVRFHGLYRSDAQDAIAVSSVDGYDDIDPNAIDDAWRHIASEQIGQEMEEVYA